MYLQLRSFCIQHYNFSIELLCNLVIVQTANKMLINHLQEIYLLRYDMCCKQTIKHLLQMVNIREDIFKQQFSMLISFRGCLPHSNNLLTLRLTMHNNISKVKLSIVNKHINNSFANDKSHYNNLPRFVQTANKQYIFCNSISKVNLFQEITYVISRNL